MLSALRTHRALVAVLVLGVVLRVAVEIAYRPALFYAGDSSQYLKLALTGGPVGIAYERPSGYPLLIHLIFAFGRSLTLLTVIQHVAGLITGVLTYALLLRVGARRGVAAAGAALVLLDGYALALEQHVLAEAFFTPMLVGAMLLAAGRPGDGERPGLGRLAAAGLLLGLAAWLRTEAVFAIPALLLYVLWRHTGRRAAALAVALVACAAPLLAYAGWHHAHTGRYALTSASGWFLYARIGEIGDCGAAKVPAEGRVLCRRVPRDDREGASYHLWSPKGTAHRAFGSLIGTPARQRRIDGILRAHALAIIRDRPLRYTGMVGADVLRYFEPGVASRSISDSAISLPAPGALMGLDPAVGGRWFNGVRPATHPPAAFVRAYARVAHTPRWLMALLVLAGAAGIATRGPRRRETFLLIAVPLSLLVVATATSDFILRYLVPLVPLLVGGGVAGALDVVARRKRSIGNVRPERLRRRAASSPPTPH